MSHSAGNQVLPFLFIGNRADAKSLDFLHKNKIRFVLNCTQPLKVDQENGCPNYFEKNTLPDGEKEFSYKRIAIFDNLGENITPHIHTAIKFIEESRHHGNVLVHCNKGVSRSVSFVVAYLMKTNDLSCEEALSMVQMFRGVAQPNPSFLEQLQRFEAELSQAKALQDKTSSYSTSSVAKDPAGASIGPCRPPLPIDAHDSPTDTVTTMVDSAKVSDKESDKVSAENAEEQEPKRRRMEPAQTE